MAGVALLLTTACGGMFKDSMTMSAPGAAYDPESADAVATYLEEGDFTAYDAEGEAIDMAPQAPPAEFASDEDYRTAVAGTLASIEGGGSGGAGEGSWLDAPGKKGKEETKAEPTTPIAKDDPGEEASSKKDDPPKAHGRQIIYTAAMAVSVYDLQDTMERAEQLPETFGGYIHRRDEGMLVLKVPADKLRDVMDQFGDFGTVLARQLQAQDVTAEFVDLQSRIRVLRDTQAQLLQLLKSAKTVEETLKVREALDRTTMELETALGRMRQLADAIAFSTLTIRFSQRGPDALPSSNDPFHWVDSLGVEATEWK